MVIRRTMTAPDDIKAFAERIQPHLEELGIEAFVMCAYKKDADGNVSRITLGGSASNPAYADGLRPIQAVAQHWGQGSV